MKVEYTNAELISYLRDELVYDKMIEIESAAMDDEILHNRISGIASMIDQVGVDGLDDLLNSVRAQVQSVNLNSSLESERDTMINQKSRGKIVAMRWIIGVVSAAAMAIFAYIAFTPSHEDKFRLALQIIQEEPPGINEVLLGDNDVLEWQNAIRLKKFDEAAEILEKQKEPSLLETVALAYAQGNKTNPDMERSLELYTEAAQKADSPQNQQLFLYAGACAIHLNKLEFARELLAKAGNNENAQELLRLINK